MGPARPPKDYTLQFSESFETPLDWEVWRTGFPWGRNVHPDWWWMWWPHRSEETSQKVIQSGDGELHLGLITEPRVWNRVDLPEWQRKGAQLREWKAPYAIGCVSTKKSFKYGWFEVEAKLPKAKGQWTAFWLHGLETWPPEIDIFESYNKTGVVEAKPNIHFGQGKNWQDGKRDMGQPDIKLGRPETRWVKYACHWTEDWIRFYYDGYLIQECTIKKALKQNEQEQYIILNNGCENPDSLKFSPDESTVLFRNLKVYQKNESNE
jgi:hypothetical protein